MPKLDKRPTAFITGGASGIGFAIARNFVQRDYRVAIVDSDSEGGEKVIGELTGFGEAIFINADISRADEARNAIVQSVKVFGKLDVVVNNAGILGPEGFILHTDSDHERVIDVNFFGPVLICKHAIAHMKQFGGGSIINISSISAYIGGPEYPVYAASKAALIGLTKSFARKYGRNNIKVNCICPGSVRDTNILLNSRGIGPSNQETLELVNAIPTGRITTPRDIAEVVFFLASPAASAMTGAVIVVDNGESLGRWK
jgi:NAD(P)-dependent dehydrogenase (short-subunit alcohol dehydrogenase family)